MIHNIPKITRPKLEQGFKPTTWSPCSIWSSSLIKQTADAVTIQVEQEIQGLSGLTERVGTLEVTASAITQEVSALSATTTGLTQQVGNLTVQSDSISASVTTLEEKVAANNLFALNGWKDNLNNYIEVDGNEMYSGSTGSSAITSPSVYLEAGTYTISAWESSNKGFTGAKPYPSGTLVLSTNKTTLTGLENAYKNIQRTYVNVTITTAGNYVFTIESNLFYKPKLEAGSVPTAYSNQTVNHSSLIQQTDSSISLKVTTEVENQGLVNETQLRETGIDITNGQITLNADKTEIIGDLELRDSEQGLKLYNNDMERVSIANEPISNINNYEFSSSEKVIRSGFTMNLNTTMDWYVDLGTYNQTQKLYVHHIYIYVSLDNDPYGDKNSSLSWTISLKQGNNVITGTTGTTNEQDGNRYFLPDFTVNSMPSTGAYTLHITATPSFTSTQGATAINYPKCALSIERYNQGNIRIGNNGAMFASGQDNFVYMGDDMTAFKKGMYEMYITPSGITRNNIHYGEDGSMYTNYYLGDISSTVPVTTVTGTTYTPKATDCVIIFRGSYNTSAQRKIILPQTTFGTTLYFPIGKKLIIRNLVNNNTVVDGATNNQEIYYKEGNSPHSDSSLSDKTWQYVFIGQSMWLEW